MSTDLVYLGDSFLFELDRVSVLGVQELQEGLFSVRVDRTIFHPQGGGQPSDTGRLLVDQKPVFDVLKAEKEQDGCVRLVGKFMEDTAALRQGDVVQQEVDQDARIMNARCHSAGHLLDIAMEDAGFAFPSTKGYHFPDSGSYVEYVGAIPAEEREDAVARIQKAFDALVEKNLEMCIQEVTPDKLADLCGEQFDAGEYSKYPSIRVARFEGRSGCPCGGTHVRNSAQIGKVKIEKIQKKGKTFRVKYALQQ